MANYDVQVKAQSGSGWSGVEYGLTLDAARKAMAGLAEEYWSRQCDREDDESEIKPGVLAQIATATPDEEICTDFCDGWGLRIVEG